MLKNRRVVPHFVVLALLACGSEKTAEPSVSVDPNIILSAPIPRASLPGGADSSGSVVFVSAMPQAVPGAVQVVVQGEAGHSATASVQDGGFDPVALGAASEDVVTVTLSYGNGTTVSKDLAVRSGRPPRVVRTSPAPHRTNVPLNAVIRVVFSSPVDLESARAAIRLTTGSGDVVPGMVEAAGVVAVEYAITAGTLEPETTYRLEVTTDVHDVLGQALAEAVSVEFRTGTTTENRPLAPGALELRVAPARINLVQGGSGHSDVTIRRGELIGAVSLSASGPAGVRATLSTSLIDTGATTATVNVVVDSGVAAGTKTVVIRAVGDGLRAVTVTKTLIVVVGAPVAPPRHPGTIALTISPSSIVVVQGGSGHAEATLTRGGSFTGAVALGVANDLGPGVHYWFSPSGIDSGATTATVNVFVVATAPLGTRTVVNRASSDRVRTATATLTVEVVAPSGSVNLVPDTDPIIVTAGAPAVTSSIAINRTGFAGPVELTVSEYEYSYQDGQYWPSGVTAIVSPGIATGATSTLSISAPANAVNGTYLLLIRGTGTGISDALKAVKVTITGGQPGFFAFDPTTVTVTAGGPSATSVLTRDTTIRLFGRLMLSVSPPPGLSASFSGRNSWYMASASATVTVQAEAAVAPGTYYVMVTGNVSAHELTNSYTWHTMLPVVVSAAPALRR